MKKAAAFLLAAALFFGTIAGCHVYMGRKAALQNPEVATWVNEEKYKSHTGIAQNLDKDVIPVFGSSEFDHLKGTAYHPTQMFSKTTFHPMLIGTGYYQCLGHAITLASIGESMTNKKAVLILSPQWFKKEGVVDQAFASRFSETHYLAMLDNEKLSDKTKEYIQNRTNKLLKVDPPTLERVQMYERIDQGEGSFWDKAYKKFWNAFLDEKERFSLVAGMKRAGIKMDGKKQPKKEDLDFEQYKEKAVAECAGEEQNPFYFDSKYYRKLKKILPGKKGSSKQARNGYSVSPEYDDLKSFLDVCKDMGIEPMLVMMPVNGYYYDYTEFPKEARQKYYQNIRDIAEEYGAKLADFSEDEYTPYFFCDRVHLGKKGWVDVNESIYRFYQENKKE